MLQFFFSLFNQITSPDMAQKDRATLKAEFTALFDDLIDSTWNIADDSEVPEVPEVPPVTAEGKTYTAAELTAWMNRTEFISDGDAFTNSPGDWDRIVSDANTYAANTSAAEWIGPLPYDAPMENVQSNYDESPGWDWYAPTHLMCAAFVDLVNDTTTYQAAIKNTLLTEARQPQLDFSDTTRFHANSMSDVMWSVADWQIKLLYAYDWVGRENFTTSEQAELDAWFIAGADWFQRILATAWDDIIISGRGGDLATEYVWDPTADDLISDPYYKVHLTGPQATKAGTYNNNRRAAMVKYVTFVGAVLDVSSMRDEGIFTAKEFLALFYYPDGTWSELHRCTSSIPDQGLKYGNNTLFEMIECAHILKINGYEDLFSFSTQFGLGGTESPGVDKSFEWACRQVKKYVDLTHETYTANTSASDQYRHTYRNTGNYNGGPSLQYINPLVLMDYHYTGSDDVFKEAYYPTAGSEFPFPSSVSSNGPYSVFNGQSGTLPGSLFMYAGLKS